MSTLKQRLGAWLIPKLPINRHVFNHFRLELNALKIRTLHAIHPGIQAQVFQLQQQRDLLVNIGCGPFGELGWINLDLYSHPQVTLVADCRRSLPLATQSCAGIHVEHFLEHLDPVDERPAFLKECHRCLQADGVLRIIVPDARKYIQAYLEPGWTLFDEIGCGGEKPSHLFSCKMDALNHVFLQGWEHYGGYDAENLELELRSAGFQRVTLCDWRVGAFPQQCIDRSQHRAYSLYIEAKP